MSPGRPASWRCQRPSTWLARRRTAAAEATRRAPNLFAAIAPATECCEYVAGRGGDLSVVASRILVPHVRFLPQLHRKRRFAKALFPSPALRFPPVEFSNYCSLELEQVAHDQILHYPKIHRNHLLSCRTQQKHETGEFVYADVLTL